MDFGRSEQLTGQYLMLNIYMISTYVSVEINASLSCTEAVRLQLTGETNQIFERDLQQAAYIAACRNYLIPLWNYDKKQHQQKLSYIFP